MKKKIKKSLNLELIPSNIFVEGLSTEMNFQQYFAEHKEVSPSFGFREYVLDSAKKVSMILGMSFSRCKYTGDVDDKEVRKCLQNSKFPVFMTREEILWVVASLASKQPNGEEGDLVIGSETNFIGYIRCAHGQIRTVLMLWEPNHNWICQCRECGIWSSGFRLRRD